MITLLLENEAAVNVASLDGSTPLLVASDRGNEDAVGLLLAFEAGVNAVAGLWGTTALFHAANRGHSRVVDLLLRNGADALIGNRRGSTPLHQACFGAHDEALGVLLRGGTPPNTADKDGYTPLHAACAAGSLLCAGLVVTTASPPGPEPIDLISATTARQRLTPAHLAARAGAVDLLEFLTDMGSDLLALDAAGQSPAGALAESLGRSQRGAADGDTVLHFAVRGGHQAVVAALLGWAGGARPVDVDLGVNASNIKGETPLHLAALHSSEETAVALCNLLLGTADSRAPTSPALTGKPPAAFRHVDVNARNKNGDHALSMAVLYKHAAVVVRLLAAGADVNNVNVVGWTPLYLAVANADTPMVDLLLRQAGLDVTVQTQVPLLVKAASATTPDSDALAIVTRLLDLGTIDPDVADTPGRTALCVAAFNGNAAVISQLVSHGANVNAGKPHPLVCVVEGAAKASNDDAGQDAVNALLWLLLRTGKASSDGLDAALGAAAAADMPSVVERLLEHGARYDVALDPAGRTAIDGAASRSRDVLVHRKNYDELVAAEDDLPPRRSPAKGGAAGPSAGAKKGKNKKKNRNKRKKGKGGTDDQAGAAAMTAAETVEAAGVASGGTAGAAAAAATAAAMEAAFPDPAFGGGAGPAESPGHSDEDPSGIFDVI